MRSEVQVAGVTFANADGSSRQEAIASLERGDALRLSREPDNPHDFFAVEVIAPRLGRQIGYLPKAVAAELSPKIDMGCSTQAVVLSVGRVGTGALGVRIAIEVQESQKRSSKKKKDRKWSEAPPPSPPAEFDPWDEYGLEDLEMSGDPRMEEFARNVRRDASARRAGADQGKEAKARKELKKAKKAKTPAEDEPKSALANASEAPKGERSRQDSYPRGQAGAPPSEPGEVRGPPAPIPPGGPSPPEPGICSCAACGKRNRIPAGRAGTPKCGRCGAALAGPPSRVRTVTPPKVEPVPPPRSRPGSGSSKDEDSEGCLSVVGSWGCGCLILVFLAAGFLQLLEDLISWF